MNVAVLFGSPRKNGSTARLLDAFLAALPAGASVKIFHAYEMAVRPCVSCGLCAEKWGCAFEDDMSQVVEAMLDCDVLVIASPVYFLSFPAPLKAIVDRTQRCFAASLQKRSPFEGKQRQVAMLLAAGAPSEDGSVIQRQVHWLAQSIGARIAGKVVCPDTDRRGVTDSALEQARRLAEKISGGEPDNEQRAD